VVGVSADETDELLTVGLMAAAARKWTDQALAAAESIAGDEDRDLLLADLETIPGQRRYW
jgi:hypothetical protein